MKRDIELIRNILIHIEDDPRFDGKQEGIVDHKAIGSTQEQLNYHLRLMEEAQLISIIVTTEDAENEYIYVERLTNKGHEFLEQIKDSDVWSATKKGAHKIGSMSLETVFEIAKGVIKTRIKAWSGVDIEL